MSLFDIIAWVSKLILSINILFLLSISIRNKHLSRPNGLLLVFLLGTLCIDLLSVYFATRGIDNLYLTHYYTIGQLLILSVIYYSFLKKFQLAVPIGAALFSGIFLYQLLTVKIVYDEFNTTAFLVSACILMCYAFFYFIEHISEKKYWDTFNVGLFLYLGGSSIIFLTMNSWKDLAGWNMMIWTINASLSVLFQVFIFLTIYRYYRALKNQNGISSI